MNCTYWLHSAAQRGSQVLFLVQGGKERKDHPRIALVQLATAQCGVTFQEHLQPSPALMV